MQQLQLLLLRQIFIWALLSNLQMAIPWQSKQLILALLLN
jgi:hypothetical protein